ncbi:hypothetical protein BV22DRAFT_1032730 [Leucogyrophana mollusca]|uniref:Uncharacterized protein n=1 Tax=Leucogyrophana mollusca TaxID=85980 RepID=A0ACB8BLZ1_9AGAM|nr:hypothetical protein BV22DRAFT_1032730 [Leucogyrophana mollusca]
MPERLEITVKYRGEKADQLTSANDGLAWTILRKDLIKLRAHLPSQRTLRHIGATFCFSWILESSPGDKRSTGHESVLRKWQKLSSDNEPELREIRQSLSIESITVVTSAVDSPEAAPSASKTLPSRPEPHRSQAPPLSSLPDKPPPPSKANSSNLLNHSGQSGWNPPPTFTTPESKSKSRGRIWTRGEDILSSGDQETSRKRTGSPLMRMGAGNKRRPDTSTEMLHTLSGSLQEAGEQRDLNGPSAGMDSPSHQPQPVQGQPSEQPRTTVGDLEVADSIIVRVKSEPSPEPQLQPPPQHIPLPSHPAPKPPTSRNNRSLASPRKRHPQKAGRIGRAPERYRDGKRSGGS